MTPTHAPVRCFACSRRLTDPVSIEFGIGPECRERAGFVELPAEVQAAIRNVAATGKWSGSERAAVEAADPKLARRGDRFIRAATRARSTGRVEIVDDVSDDVDDDGSGLETVVTGIAADHKGFAGAISSRKLDSRLIDAARAYMSTHQGRTIDTLSRLVTGEVKGASIVGYAGTGKTACLVELAKILGNGRPKDVTVVAPTGKAALRIRASGLNATTIHKLCYRPRINPKTGEVVFDRVAPSRSPVGGIIMVDEGSMVGGELEADVLWAAEVTRSRILTFGDSFQLPPVSKGPRSSGPSKSLLDRWSVEGSDRTTLTELRRQGAESTVAVASMHIREGRVQQALDMLPAIDGRDVVDAAVKLHRKWVSDPQSDYMVIVHTNAARQPLNHAIRVGLGRSSDTIDPGEPLLCKKNNYEVGCFNGELVSFQGWIEPPRAPTYVVDRYSQAKADVHFGLAGVSVRNADPVPAILCLEQVAGMLDTKLGESAIAVGAMEWSRRTVPEWWETRVYEDADGQEVEKLVAPAHINANFGYVYTAHASQGSQAKRVLVVSEPTVKIFDKASDEGRRHFYTSVTRAQDRAAVSRVGWEWVRELGGSGGRT